MASYVENNLMTGEEILYTGRIHWFVYVPGAVLLFLACFTAVFEGAISLLMAMLGIILLINALIRRKTTELAVTNRRVICKLGLIRRSTMELNLSRVESCNVDQSILGRIFDYGTVSVNGTGGGQTPIRTVDSPLEFRKKAMEAIDSSQSSQKD